MDEPKKRPLPERAADAIPEDALHLHNAFNWFCWQFDDIPSADEFLADVAGNEIIEPSMRLLQADDPNAYETDSFLWRIEAAAHVLFRGALSVKLRAYIRDPDYGQTLKLGYDGWYPDWWGKNEAFVIPAGPSSPYVHPDDLSNPGPLTATLRGLMRPVFFKTEEFRAWARPIIQSVSVKAGQLPPGDPDIAGRKLAATVATIKKIWGEDGPPQDLTAKARNEHIHRRLTKDGYESPSAQTIRRALALARSGRS